LATGAIAGFLALLPVVGPAIAWVPYATVLWSTGRELQCMSLAVACISAAWVVELCFRRLAQRLGADSLWFAFMLFCGLVGGIASFGLRGVIIGPAAALTAAALFGFLPAVYGVGREGRDAPG
jgi:predicted PurR-regulated permease PerM